MTCRGGSWELLAARDGMDATGRNCFGLVTGHVKLTRERSDKMRCWCSIRRCFTLRSLFLLAERHPWTLGRLVHHQSDFAEVTLVFSFVSFHFFVKPEVGVTGEYH